MNFINFIPFFYLLASIIIIALFIYFFKKRNSKLDIENNKIPLYSENCGGRFGLINFSIPFVRLTIYDKFIIISHIKKIVLNYNEIINIEIKRNIISKGLFINHNRNDIPQTIIIWSFNCDKIN